jgi:hypothetical protein
MNRDKTTRPSKIIELIHRRPGLFFPKSTFNTIDSGSLFLPFLEAVFSGYCFTLPKFVSLETFRDYQIFLAEECSFLIESIYHNQVPVDFDGYDGLIDWAHYQTVSSTTSDLDPLEPFSSIAFIIYASDLCLLDISSEREHFRQFFVGGRALMRCHRTSLSKDVSSRPFVRLQCVPSSKVFTVRELEGGDFTAFVHENRGKTLPSSIEIISRESISTGFKATYRARKAFSQQVSIADLDDAD